MGVGGRRPGGESEGEEVGSLERCPSCDSDSRDSSHLAFKHDCHVYRCSCCGLVYVNPQPSAESLSEMYNFDYFQCGGFDKYGYRDYESLLKLKRWSFQRWLGDLESFAKPGKLLEVGCATGLMLEIARDAGWRVSGVELSKYAAEEARKRGLEVHSDDLDKITVDEGTFDVVLMLDLLEHIAAPAALLESAHRLLKVGGLIYAVTPNAGGLSARIQGASWPHFKPKEHLCLFSKKSLRCLVERCGFEVVRLSNFRKVMTLEHLIDELGATNPLVVSVLRASCKVLPNLRTRRFYLPLGEMRIVARKTSGPVF